MFDFVRKHTRVMQFMLFLLIVPSFVLFGLEGYSRMNEKGAVVAKVDGQEITQSEWDAEHKNEVDRMRQQMPTLDAKFFDAPEARYSTLERMVRDRVLAAAATKFHLGASDQRLARELQQNEAIASLRGPDGKLDMQRYRQLLGAQGMTPEMFENQVRSEIAARQVLAGIASTSVATPAQASVALGAFFERREVQVARFDAAEFASKVNPTEAEIEAFYQANPQLFQAPEQATIEYVVLDTEAVKKGLTVNEQDLKTYYEQNQARLAGQEERRASHILITAPKDAPAAERDKARARAQELLEQVRKAPASFAELAKKHSQDPGSAANGGDLDFFSRGAMTKAFEDVAFALKKDEISDVVETEFGFHIIKLSDIKAPRQRSFEEMRPELEAEVLKQQVQRKFAETAEAFSNAAYEAGDGLKSVAERFKLELKTAKNVVRTPPPGAAAPLNNPKFIAAVFSPDSVEKKRNTEAVEIGPNQLAAARITEYTPARTRPLAEVKDAVRQRVVAARGAELAKKEGADKLAAWKANPAAAALPAPVVVSRDNPAKQPTEVVEAALRADAGALPAFAGVDLGPQGYAVVKVNKSLPRPAPEAQAAKQEVAQYNRWWSSAEGIAYYNLLKDRFNVKMLVAQPAGKSAEDATR